MITRYLFRCNLIVEKQYLEEQALLLDSFRLAVKVFADGFRPSFIVGLWRGGSEVGIYVQECLQTLGVEADHISIRTSYRGAPEYPTMVSAPEKHIRVHGTEYLVNRLNTDDRLLIVDDVFSSGYSIQAVTHHLKKRLRRNYPRQVKVATLYQRPGMNRTGYNPDYCMHETEKWLVLPYEMSGLSREEIHRHKPYLSPFLVD